MLGACSGASSQECCGKGFREIFPEIRCRAPELTLLEDEWNLGKDFVGKREHEHRVRELCGEGRKLIVFIILFALLGRTTVTGSKYLVFVFLFPSSHTSSSSHLYHLPVLCPEVAFVIKSHLPLFLETLLFLPLL